MSQLNGKYDDQISYLREWMGIIHHDDISGTVKQHVANNYALKLYKTIAKCENVVNEAVNKLTKSEPKTEQLFCQMLNISACAVTERNDSLALNIFNPTAHSVKHIVRLPITNNAYQVFDPTGNPVKIRICADSGGSP